MLSRGKDSEEGEEGGSRADLGRKRRKRLKKKAGATWPRLRGLGSQAPRETGARRKKRAIGWLAEGSCSDPSGVQTDSLAKSGRTTPSG